LPDEEQVSGTDSPVVGEAEQAPPVADESPDQAPVAQADSEGAPPEATGPAQAPELDWDAQLENEDVLKRLLSHPRVHSRINEEAHQRKLADEPLLRQQIERETRARLEQEQAERAQQQYARDLRDRDPDAYVAWEKEQEARRQQEQELQARLAPQVHQEALGNFWQTVLKGRANDLQQAFGQEAVNDYAQAIVFATQNHQGSDFLDRAYREVAFKYGMAQERQVMSAKVTAAQASAVVGQAAESPEAGGAGSNGGGLTMERYLSMSREQREELRNTDPEAIDRMTAAEMARAR
jgi:hypothetical protein